MGVLKLLAADLLAFDRHALAWRLASRTVLALLIPLAAARILDCPVAVYVGLGGFLLSIGDCVDDGDRQQIPRLLVGTIAGSLAIASGTLMGGGLATAVAGALLWCGIAGLLGAYGTAFAAMGLPIAWAFVELGVPAASHSPGYAATLGACWLGGGVLAYLLAQLVRIGSVNRPLKERTAAAYRELAEYFDTPPSTSGTVSVISPETRLRSAIAEARRVADISRRGQHGAEWQQLLLLIEVADWLFGRAAVWRENASVHASSGQALAAHCSEVARRILGGGLAARSETVAIYGEDRRGREIASVLDRAARIAADAEPVRSIATSGNDLGTPRLAEMLSPLHACLDPKSVVGRHALRFGLVTSTAVAVGWFFPPPFGYWVPLTVTVVLKPYAGVTMGRTVQRVVGTVLGALLGMALMPLLPGVIPQMIAVTAAFFCMMAVLPTNYSLAILFLSLGVVPFEHVLYPDLTVDVGFWRLYATGVGVVLGIVGGHLLWPNFEREQLPGLLNRSLRSVARYAAAALDANERGPGGRGLADARRSAGIDATNFHMTAQRSLSELDPAGISPQRVVASAAILQRMMLVSNAIAQGDPGERPVQSTNEIRAALFAFADGTVPAVDAVAELRRWHGMAVVERPDDPLAGEIDALASQIEVLADENRLARP